MRVSMSAKLLFRYHARRALYGCRLTRNIASRMSRTSVRTPEETARYWDEMLSGTTWKTYLGDTFSIDARNAIIDCGDRTQCPSGMVNRLTTVEIGGTGASERQSTPPTGNQTRTGLESPI